MEYERIQQIALWALQYTDQPNLVSSILHGHPGLAEQRLQRLLEGITPLPDKAQAELIHLLKAPLDEIIPQRTPDELAEYAMGRYVTYYKNEAPKDFRTRFHPTPTLEAVLELGRIKRWWSVEQESQVRQALAKHLPA